jgi:hydroxymethylpyrimidine pyrophosphatase-like HAD family hydrolase
VSSKYIGIDFDGTMVRNAYPEVGLPVEGALDTVKDLIDFGHKIILYTMRSGERLVQAVEYLEEHGVKLYAVNENPSQKYWTESPKIFCNLYIDDLAIGVPLVNPPKGKPFVNWGLVRDELLERGFLE